MITLTVKQLKKSFGPNTIFSDVTFDHQASALGVAGSNGSGKSTFLKCLSGLLSPTNGSIEWKNNGHPLTSAVFKQKLGYAAPYINLYDELNCRENLNFIAKMRHRDNAEPAIDLWLTNVGLAAVQNQPYGKLSTGQQQRLRLASALFYDPDILLLDEPGSNLDESGRELIRKITVAFNKPEKLLIIASNNPAELDLCDKIFSIEEEVFV